MEQQEVQVDEGISLVEIFKLLLSHIKLLIISVLIACVVGGSFAVLTTYDVQYFGTMAKFYVNPKKGDVVTDSDYGVYGTYSVAVMDGMVQLLNSESFSEQLMLNGEDLPEKNVWGDDATQNATLDGLIDAAQIEVDALKTAQDTIEAKTEEKADASLALTEANKALTEANKELSEKYTELNSEWEMLRLKYSTETSSGQIQSVFSVSFNENVYNDLKQDPAHSGKIPATLDVKYTAWKEASNLQQEKEEDKNEAQQNVDDLTSTINDLEKNLRNVQKKTNEEVSKAIDEWRKTAKYKEALKKYNASVSFFFMEDDSEITTVDKLARSFITVEVSVLNGEQFAQDLFEAVKLVVPTYVESNMPKVNGYNETNCRRITIDDDVEKTNPGYTVKQAIKYAAIAGIATLLVACFVIILIDKSDKRLRDVEVISKKFNLPVLGIIPNMDDLDSANNANKEVE